MKAENKKTKIFLDSGDPNETKQILSELGYLDGQTTNPTLVAKNPDVVSRFASGRKFTEKEIYKEYRRIVGEISALIPNGSVSIEVYSNQNTTSEKMFNQALELYEWIPNAHIKYPITDHGLRAAHISTTQGIRINMTLCFSQQQAASVYAATIGTKRGEVFISPFIGRLDDIGFNGMDLISNIVKMYKHSDGHVEVLAASVRTIEHFMLLLALGADIITAPYVVLKQWAQNGQPRESSLAEINSSKLKTIAYEQIGLDEPWQKYLIQHDLTTKGIDRFTSDWEALLK